MAISPKQISAPERTTSYARQGIDFYRRFAVNRQKTYDLVGPVAPIDGMPEFVIPKSTFIASDKLLESSLARAIERIDRDMLIVYDPLTNLPGQPAHHLYTRIPNFYKGGHAKLILEFSLQESITVSPDGAAYVDPWPTGIPKAPGWWVLPILQAIYKGRRSGDIDATNRQIAASRAERMLLQEVKAAKKDDDTRDMLYREVFEPLWVRGRTASVSLGSVGNASNLHRSAPEKPLIVRVKG